MTDSTTPEKLTAPVLGGAVDLSNLPEQPENTDPIENLYNKVQDFVLQQPEFYAILQLPRPSRRKIGFGLGKRMVTFPHFNKLGVVRGE